jgi:hypothetical protein
VFVLIVSHIYCALPAADSPYFVRPSTQRHAKVQMVASSIVANQAANNRPETPALREGRGSSESCTDANANYRSRSKSPRFTTASVTIGSQP